MDRRREAPTAASSSWRAMCCWPDRWFERRHTARVVILQSPLFSFTIHLLVSFNGNATLAAVNALEFGDDDEHQRDLQMIVCECVSSGKSK